MDLYNGWCSGNAKVKITTDGHIFFWMDDMNEQYQIKFKSMIIYVPNIESRESPIVIFEADNDQVEPENQGFVSGGKDHCLEGLCIQSKPEKVTYNPEEIFDFQMHCEYDEAFMIPPYYEIVRFLDRRIFGCLNIQGLSY